MINESIHSPYCLLFPGQGAQQQAMLTNVRAQHLFKSYYKIVCDVLQRDLLAELAGNEAPSINQNLISSMLVTLTSSVALQVFLAKQHKPPTYLSGYSVGQWTSLYAAGAISFGQLIEIVAERARIMDACVASNPSGMIAVIGVDEARLTAFCETLQQAGHVIAISNYNCHGQYSLAGTESAVLQALTELENLQPKKFLRIPVSGAWHSRLLAPAAAAFAAYLASVSLKKLEIPVIDNVSGDFLPDEVDLMKDCLARHLCMPVLWEKGIKRLIKENCSTFIEMGYGTTLTKFGFFIDRSVQHQAYYCQDLLQEA